MQVENSLFFAAVEERIKAGNQVKITLVGTSMQPTLCEGDVLTLASLNGEPSVGDVVLFRYRGRHLLHRIISVADGLYTTQGDNCIATECCRREDIVAKLVAVKKRHLLKHFVLRWFGHRGRRQLRPWYFVALAILMWTPLNGLGVPLDNYILGLRADHLLHASVYLLCPLFLMDFFKKNFNFQFSIFTWLSAVAVGMLTESVQYLLPYRGFDINDLVANTLGVTLGWVAILILRIYLHRYKPAR